MHHVLIRSMLLQSAMPMCLLIDSSGGRGAASSLPSSPPILRCETAKGGHTSCTTRWFKCGHYIAPGAE
jgi:hypothetical protein